MLSEEKCKVIERGLSEDVEPRKVAAYLCLHMGLTLAEVGALRLSDIDFTKSIIHIHNVLTRSEGETEFNIHPSDMRRGLLVPPHVLRYLNIHRRLYEGDDRFIISGNTDVPVPHMMQNILTTICLRYNIANNLSATDLRYTFIRRCIESGIDLYSLCWYVGIRQPNVILNKFRKYMKVRLDNISELEKYTLDYNPLLHQLPHKRMNLLILGAGSQGQVVKETAEDMGIFNEIAFLDDDSDNKLAIDKCSNYFMYIDKYPIAFASFGCATLREKYINLLEEAGFILPVLISPMATISSSAKIAESTIVEAKAIVGANSTVGRGGIISSASVIDVNVSVGAYSHIDCAATVRRNTNVPSHTKVESGIVI